MTRFAEPDIDENEALPSVEIFARNVADCKGLGFLLIDVARAELGPLASQDQIEHRASNLLLQSLCCVGIDPKSELVQRERLFSLLRGDPLSSAELQKAVEYILSQMVIQPKGALAECLAIASCSNYLNEMKSSRQLPPGARFMRGAWCHRLSGCREDGLPIFAEWREAADGLFYCVPEPQMHLASCGDPPRPPLVRDDDLLVLGVAEVKCSENVSRQELSRQLDHHVVRLSGGLQLRDASGRIVEREYEPEAIWYAIWKAGTIEALPVTMTPFRVNQQRTSRGSKLAVDWTMPAMKSLLRLTIGPQSSTQLQAKGHKRRGVFDMGLPYDEDELEEIGTAIAYYTLGAMADQPEVDLSWTEWSRNLQLALEFAAMDSLSRKHLARREKILRRVNV